VSALVVVGDALLDRDVVGTVERLSPDAPVPVVDQDAVRSRPGGAGLAAVLAAADAEDVTLVTALGDDAAGDEVRAMLATCGVGLVDLGMPGTTPEKIRIGPAGRPLLRLDRGAGGAIGDPDVAARSAIAWADALLVADYGRGVAAAPAMRALLAGVRTPVVWDPHPRGPAPVAGAALVTPNLAEARTLVPDPPGDGTPALARRARTLARRWDAAAVCVTCGARGAVLVAAGGPPLAVPADPAPGGDPCGAGDRFAARAAAALADGATSAEAVVAAVRAASEFVAAGGATAIAASPAAPPARDPSADALLLAERTRACGGVVVATGGCFDLLHPGHVRTLEAARALGDCLVVCLNADASVRRLKGPGRPVVGEADRAAVLRALACVDAVLVFSEDTPAAALERLRPDVWAKGADYAGRSLPEADVLAGWGGEVVLLPLLPGNSTTRIIQEASLRAIG
jgi:rfaE bifunctional protein nucleotidyltransferase chain/domain/rfaE bifunctional protein kinase chain/domain